jgi:hypothetical protein
MSHKHPKELAQRLILEIDTRKCVLDIEEENIQEFINILFPLIEAIRVVLREHTTLITEEANAQAMYVEACKLVNLFLRFEDKWNYSYSNWHSSFRSNKSNKKELGQGEGRLFYTIQNYFPNIDEILKDMQAVRKETNKFVKTINGLALMSSYRFKILMFLKRWFFFG